jgi:hypothetical protein
MGMAAINKVVQGVANAEAGAQNRFGGGQGLSSEQTQAIMRLGADEMNHTTETAQSMASQLIV